MNRIFALLFVLLSLSAVAQQADEGTRQNRGSRPNMPAPKVAQHNGHPALEFDAPAGTIYIEDFSYQGEPALGFTFAQDQCIGHVYATRTRIAGDFRNTACRSFDVARESTTIERDGGVVTLTSEGTSYKLVPVVERGDQQRLMERAQLPAEMFGRAVKAFAKTYAAIRRMSLEAQPAAATNASSPVAAAAARTAANRSGTVTITSDPGDTQVYINDEPRGMTSSEGREVLPLKPGTYRLRVSLPGYQDFEQSVTVAAGQNQDVAATLAPVGPPPFSASDVEEMLKGAMSPKRIASLVQERGVAFAMTADLEKRMRALGASGDLIHTLSTSKK